jgi:ATP-dependent RNA helicase DeaD
MTSAETDTVTTFADLGLADSLLAVLTRLGYEEPTPIQREAIPPLLEVATCSVRRRPAPARPRPSRCRCCSYWRRARVARAVALVLVPTRELAIQVAEAMHRYGRDLNARVLPIYGGQPIGQSAALAAAGVDFIVATPGRALDHLRRGTLPIRNVRCVVLDEADEMLDMGFAEDIERSWRGAGGPADRALLRDDAAASTASPATPARSRPHRIARGRDQRGGPALVRQTAYIVRASVQDRSPSPVSSTSRRPTAAIVFCRTRTEVDELTETLGARGYRAEALHGGMSQEQRDRVMGRCDRAQRNCSSRPMWPHAASTSST